MLFRSPGCIAVTYPVQEKEALQAIAAACIREKADLVAPEAEDIHLRRGLICINKCGADRSFSISGQKTLSIMWVYLEQDSGRKDGWNEGISGKKFEGS